MHKVSDRKPDVRDTEWIADLVRYGLLKFSFMPPSVARKLRALVRCHWIPANQFSTERNWVLKLFEGANVKRASVVTDVFGVSGPAMLAAVVQGGGSMAKML